MRQWRTHNASLVKFHATSETQLTKRKSCSSRTQVTQPKRMSSLSLASLFSLLSLSRSLAHFFLHTALKPPGDTLGTYTLTLRCLLLPSSKCPPTPLQDGMNRNLVSLSHTHTYLPLLTHFALYFFSFRSLSFLLDALS